MTDYAQSRTTEFSQGQLRSETPVRKARPFTPDAMNMQYQPSPNGMDKTAGERIYPGGILPSQNGESADTYTARVNANRTSKFKSLAGESNG